MTRTGFTQGVVYALKQGQRIVYIGESTNLQLRLEQHRPSKTWDGVTVLFKGDENTCFRMEAEYLLDYNASNGEMPLYNRHKVKAMERRLHKLAVNGGLRRRALNKLGKRRGSVSQIAFDSFGEEIPNEA